jgi:hypothetical protein
MAEKAFGTLPASPPLGHKAYQDDRLWRRPVPAQLETPPWTLMNLITSLACLHLRNGMRTVTTIHSMTLLYCLRPSRRFLTRHYSRQHNFSTILWTYGHQVVFHRRLHGRRKSCWAGVFKCQRYGTSNHSLECLVSFQLRFRARHFVNTLNLWASRPSRPSRPSQSSCCIHTFWPSPPPPPSVSYFIGI